MITVPLLRSMPPKKVLELQMTGRRVNAEEADRIGFVTRVVPVDELDAAVDELAASLASKSPLVLRWGRDAFYRVLEMDADAALDYLQGMLDRPHPVRGRRRGRRRVRGEAHAGVEGPVTMIERRRGSVRAERRPVDRVQRRSATVRSTSSSSPGSSRIRSWSWELAADARHLPSDSAPFAA